MKKILLTTISLLSLFSCTNTTQSDSNSITEDNKTTESTTSTDSNASKNILIAYFSATGSTERVAGYIKNETEGTTFEVEPKNQYTSSDLNYNNTNSRVYQEYQDVSKRDVELAKTTPDDFSKYSIVFIGYPIWWGIAAWPINNFVKDNDFTNKTIIPFCTSASSSMGNSAANLQSLNNTGTWLEGRRFSSGANESTVSDWVKSLNL